MARRKAGETIYGDFVPGDPGNYDQRVRFDVTDRFVGITQWRDNYENGAVDRVLLSPAQIRALKKFLVARG